MNKFLFFMNILILDKMVKIQIGKVMVFHYNFIT